MNQDNRDKTQSHLVILVGTAVAQYRITDHLGAGGMGEVYLAHDTRLERSVALKFLPAHLLTDPSYRLRFTQEAQAAARINHPNIVTIYEVGEFDGRPFIAMEHLQGETLKSLLSRKAVTPDLFAPIMREIAAGVTAAHTQGVIHRDLKPENVMVVTGNRIKIMDFGLAYQLAAENNLTRTGTVMGTPHYMSPEQVKGEQVDLRTDIFSLGVIFYEMLGGCRPFEGDYHLAVLYAIVNHQPKSLDELAPFAPPELVAITNKCLQKQPEERYRNGEELLAELNAIGRGSEEQARTTRSIRLAVDDQLHAGLVNELVGRDSTLKLLTGHFTRVREGEGATVLVSGEAGVGKSSLARAMSRLARSNEMNVLRGRCLFEEGQIPYHPFFNALRDAFIVVDDHLLAALLARGKAHGIDLTPLLPVIRSFLNISTDSVTLVNREQLWAAVLSLLTIMATERPMLLIIDDLQWADKGTLALFSYLARSCSTLPILLIGLHRDEEKTEATTDSGGLAQIARQLRIDNIATMIELHRLTLEETSKLLGQILEKGEIDPGLSKAVYERSLGNPLFSNELVKLLRASNRLEFVNDSWRLTDTATALPVPQRVQDVIVNRLEGIASDQRELMEFASCEGESFQSDILVGCLKKNRIDVLKMLQTLEKEQALIRHREHLYYFDHPLIREVLYDGVLPELREEYHRLIAEWLVEKHASDREYAARIAHHLLASRQEADALSFLLSAADRAKELHALEDASGYYQRALAILSRRNVEQKQELVGVYEGLGDVYFLLGNGDDARKCYERLLAYEIVTESPLHRAIIQRKLSDAQRALGNTQEATILGKEALDSLRTLGNSFELVRALNSVAFLLFNRFSDWGAAIPMLTEAQTLAESENDIGGQIMSLNNLGLAEAHWGNYEAALVALEHARHLQGISGDLRGRAQTENHLGIVYFPRGRYEEAISNLQSSLDIRRRISDHSGVPGSMNGLGDVYRELGDVKRAFPLHKQALELARQRNNKAAQCDNLRDLGEDLMILGDLKGAKAYLDEALALSTEIKHLWYRTRTHTALGFWSLAFGNPDEADSFSTKALQMAREQAAKGLIVEASWARGMAMAARRQFNESIMLLEESVAIAREGQFRSYLWRILRDVSKLYQMSGNASKGREALVDAKATITEILSYLSNPEYKAIFLATPGVNEILSAE